MVYLHVVLFLFCQVIANLLFKWGSSAPHLAWWGFALGNFVGITSILFMLGMYKALPAATVLSISAGGVFVLNQIVMYCVFHEKIAPAALVGICLIAIGTFMATFLNRPVNTQQTDPQQVEQQEIPLEITNKKGV